MAYKLTILGLALAVLAAGGLSAQEAPPAHDAVRASGPAPATEPSLAPAAPPAPSPAPTPETTPAAPPLPAAAPAPPSGPALGRPATMADLLAAIPGEARSFIAVGDIGDVATKTLMLAQKTGFQIPLKDRSVSDLLSLKVSIRGGMAARGSAGIAYLSPVDYKGRNTVFLIPVQGREAFLEYNAAKEVDSGIYQVTGAAEPRFFMFREGHAVFSDSLRTSRALRDGAFDLPRRLSDEQKKALDQSDVYVHIDLEQTLADRREKAAQFRQAVASKILSDPSLYAYADLLTSYINTVNDVVNQVSGLDIGLALGAEDVGLSVLVRFDESGGIFNVLQGLTGTSESLLRDLPLDRPYVSAGGLTVKPELLRDLALRAADTLMQNAAQSRKGLQPQTRDQVLGAISGLLNQMTGEVAFMSALPDPQSGATQSNLLVVKVKDAKEFGDARGQLLSSMSKVADEIDSKVKFANFPNKEQYRDVEIDHLRPVISFLRKPYEQLFEERSKALYGPDGFVYRMALVKDRMLLSLGSDQTLLRAAIDQALDEKPPASAEEIAKTRAGLPASRNFECYVNLPAMLSRSMLLAGSASGAVKGPLQFDDQDRQYMESREVVGFAVSLEGGRVRFDGRAGYQQLARAIAFAQKHVPSVPAPQPAPTPEPEKPQPSGPTPEPGGAVPWTPAPEPSPGPVPEPETPEPQPAPGTGPSAEPPPAPTPAR